MLEAEGRNSGLFRLFLTQHWISLFMLTRRAQLDRAEDDLATVPHLTRCLRIPTSSRTSPTSPLSTQPSKSLNPVTHPMELPVPIIPLQAHPHQSRPRAQLLPLAPSRSPSFGSQHLHSQVSSLRFSKAVIDLRLSGLWHPRRTKRTTEFQARRRRKGQLRLNGRSVLEWSRQSDCWRRRVRRSK